MRQNAGRHDRRRAGCGPEGIAALLRVCPGNPPRREKHSSPTRRHPDRAQSHSHTVHMPFRMLWAARHRSAFTGYSQCDSGAVTGFALYPSYERPAFSLDPRRSLCYLPRSNRDRVTWSGWPRTVDLHRICKLSLSWNDTGQGWPPASLRDWRSSCGWHRSRHNRP